MTKKIVFTILQFILFLAIFVAGSFLAPLHLHHWGPAAHYFVPDGLLLAAGVFLVILLIQAVRHRLCNSPWTILAFVAALAISYWLKIGFVTPEISLLQGLAHIHEYIG